MFYGVWYVGEIYFGRGRGEGRVYWKSYCVMIIVDRNKFDFEVLVFCKVFMELLVEVWVYRVYGGWFFNVV